MKMQTHKLSPFSPLAGEALSLEAEIEARPEGLRLVYRLHGNLDALVWPVHSNGSRRDELWKRTCFEIFLKDGDQSIYDEWNFSPSTDWAHYDFSDYRQKLSSNARIMHLRRPLDWQKTAEMMTLTVEIPWPVHFLSTDFYYYSLTAVLEHRGGELSYWAMHHAGDRPDFHNARSFVGRLRTSHRGP